MVSLIPLAKEDKEKFVKDNGFHIVEFFNEIHPDPHCDDEGKGEDFDGMFRFEKRIGM